MERAAVMFLEGSSGNLFRPVCQIRVSISVSSAISLRMLVMILAREALWEISGASRCHGMRSRGISASLGWRITSCLVRTAPIS